MESDLISRLSYTVAMVSSIFFYLLFLALNLPLSQKVQLLLNENVILLHIILYLNYNITDFPNLMK